MTARLLVLALWGGWLSGCAQAPINAPLSRTSPAAGYRSHAAAAPRDGSGLMVALFFSGGGTRAAALSYGVLRELRATPVSRDHRMLDEVTTINAVSGGSFTAAYYCLYGDRIFTDYEPLFLKRDVERGILSRCLSPVNGIRLCSPRFGRSDIAAMYYDEVLFHGATFGDLAAMDGPRPYLVINATNISSSIPLQFTQDQFDLIGSDLSRFPISRAVAASSAVPGILSPIILKNYSDRAPAPGAALFQPPGQWDVFAGYRSALTENALNYRDAAKHPYIYLVDGGLTDNLALRNLLETVNWSGGWESMLERLRRGGVTKLAIIVVDATAEPSPGEGSPGKVPGSAWIIRTLSDSSINRASKDTIALLEASLALRQASEAKAPGRAGSGPKVYLIHVCFRLSTDPTERAFLDGIPTSLHLPAETVDRLIEGGGRLLRDSPAFQTLLSDLRFDSRSQPPP